MRLNIVLNVRAPRREPERVTRPSSAHFSKKKIIKVSRRNAPLVLKNNFTACFVFQLSNASWLCPINSIKLHNQIQLTSFFRFLRRRTTFWFLSGRFFFREGNLGHGKSHWLLPLLWTRDELGRFLCRDNSGNSGLYFGFLCFLRKWALTIT
jgi:hypothetical protein